MSRARCPCCESDSLDGDRGTHEICAVCGWEDDPVQARLPSMRGGANVVSLDEARANFAAHGVSDPRPPAIRRSIRAACRTFVARDELDRKALACGALPIYADMGGTIAIAEDGELVAFDDRGVETSVDEPLRTVALVVGARRFAFLTVLLPVPLPTSTTCATCDGRGFLDAGAACGACRALGWK